MDGRRHRSHRRSHHLNQAEGSAPAGSPFPAGTLLSSFTPLQALFLHAMLNRMFLRSDSGGDRFGRGSASPPYTPDQSMIQIVEGSIVPETDLLLGKLATNASRLHSAIVVPLRLGSLPQLRTELVDLVTEGNTFNPVLWSWAYTCIWEGTGAKKLFVPLTDFEHEGKVLTYFTVVGVIYGQIDLRSCRVYMAGPSLRDEGGFRSFEPTREWTGMIFNKARGVLPRS